MTHKAAYFAPITGFFGSINHALSGFLFESTGSSKRAHSEKFSDAHIESSVFSKADASELLINESDIDPLLEAEVYAIYGRRKDAEKVLDSALKAGLISAGDVSLFWSIRDKDRTTPPQLAQ